MKSEFALLDLASMQEIANASNAFGLELYADLRGNRSGNLIISPYSISSAFMMLAEAARNQTYIEMAGVLHLPEHREGLKDLHHGHRSLLDSFVSHTDTLPGSDSRVNLIELLIANSIWLQRDYPVSESYRTTLAENYRTGGVFSIDFRRDSEQARRQINDWINDRTNGLIENFIPHQGLSPATLMVLCNAIYFKADWQSQFDPSETRELDFHVGDGTLDRVWMMRHRSLRGIKYAAFDGNGAHYPTPYETYPDEDVTTCYPDQFGFQVVSLPYQGERLSMLLFVPQRFDGIARIESLITKPGMLEKWITSFIPFTVNLSMPKVRIRSDLDLVPTLIDMGMVRAFTSPLETNGAQFSGITHSNKPEDQPFVNQVHHSAVIELSETGTEATAATRISMLCTGLERAKQPFVPIVNANRPFLFAIRDELSGTILFLGKIVRPD